MNKPEAMANINRHTNAEGQESRRVPPLDTEQQGINEKREKERETASPRGEPLIGYATQGLETILIQTIKMDSGDCIFIIVWGGAHVDEGMHARINNNQRQRDYQFERWKWVL